MNRLTLYDKELYSSLIQLHVLHHAAREGVFGLGMIEELGRHGYKLSPGTLYPLLHRLEAQGLLSSYRESVVGKIRRVYRATAAGRKALTGAKRKIRELLGEISESQPSQPKKGVQSRIIQKE
jgi:DNA-binding PadR family transcriptional regulator